MSTAQDLGGFPGWLLLSSAHQIRLPWQDSAPIHLRCSSPVPPTLSDVSGDKVLRLFGGRGGKRNKISKKIQTRISHPNSAQGHLVPKASRVERKLCRCCVRNVGRAGEARGGKAFAGLSQHNSTSVAPSLLSPPQLGCVCVCLTCICAARASRGEPNRGCSTSQAIRGTNEIAVSLSLSRSAAFPRRRLNAGTKIKITPPSS